jgi:beta-lactamase regulating signal transducer with metallopeptidase domain
VGAEAILGAVLAWVATAAVHSTVWLTGAFVGSSFLKRIVRHRVALAVVRERLYKLAIFGGLVSASIALSTGRAVPIDVPSARAVGAPPLPRSTRAVQFVAFPAADLEEPVAKQPWRPWRNVPWIELAGGFWIAGVVGGALLSLRDRRRLAKRLRGRRPLRAGPAAELFARRLAEGPDGRIELARERITLACAPRLTAPITHGLFRPEVCIPPRAERDLLDEEIEAMLAHEIAHARRRDPLLLALCRSAEVLLFFQPLLAIARRKLVEEIEILCDDRAARTTGDPAALASCLAEVATWIVADSPEASAIAMAAGRSKLERRVGLLLDRGHGSHVPGRGALLAPAAFATLASVLPLPAFAMRASEPERRPEATTLERGHDLAGEPRGGRTNGSARSLAPATVAQPRVAAPLAEEWASIRADLGALEAEFTSLRSDLALAGAPAELEARLGEVRSHLDTLRALETELDRLVAEDPSAERPEQ